MTEPPNRAGQPRDVPPPRPVAAGEPVEGEVVGADTGLGAAGRALADAVAGLLGRHPASPGGRPPRAGARAGTGVLADVLAAVGAAARSARDGESSGRSQSGRTARGSAPGGLLSELLDAAVPRLPIRDRERLRRAYPGASDSEIAEALVARAATLTGAVGAATGGLAAAQWFATPSMLALPLELGAQTLLVAAVEVVLVGELHELAGRGVAGDPRSRAGAYLSSWTAQRAVDGTNAKLFSVVGSASAAALRRRISRRLARSTTSVTPLLVGATLAARGNRKATLALADRLRADLQIDRRREGA